MSEKFEKKRRNYHNDPNMLEALAAIEKGDERSIRRIAKDFGVDSKSLRRRANQEIEIDAKIGRCQLLNSEQQQAFVDLCINMSKIGVSLTRKMLREEMIRFLQSKGIDKVPSQKYLTKFLKRNETLSIRTPPRS